MPDVALDLMEAIRSLLDGVQLHVHRRRRSAIDRAGPESALSRWRSVPGAQVAEFYDRKGREYFEKIVQLGIPVPEPTMDDAHRYVAAQFPAWAAASDLLVTACGANPRRLKQYCGLADYKLAVWKRKQEHQHRRPRGERRRGPQEGTSGRRIPLASDRAVCPSSARARSDRPDERRR